MNSFFNLLITLALTGAIIAAPFLVIVGWGLVWRDVYSKSPSDPPSSIFGRLSIGGLASSTVAALIYVYAMALQANPLNSPLWGAGQILAEVGLCLGVLGVLGPGPVRWLTPICALGVFFYLASPY